MVKGYCEIIENKEIIIYCDHCSYKFSIPIEETESFPLYTMCFGCEEIIEIEDE